MVFQAVAEYRIQVKKADINLNLELAVQERKEKTRIAIRSSNIHLSRSDKVWKYEWMFAPLMLKNIIKMMSNAHLHHTQSNSHVVCINWFAFFICLLHGLNGTVWHYEEFQYHRSRGWGGHALGEYSWTRSWCLHQHVVLCSRAPVLSSQIFSVYYALPEEKDYDCNAFDLSVQMEKASAGRIHHQESETRV